LGVLEFESVEGIIDLYSLTLIRKMYCGNNAADVGFRVSGFRGLGF
jgi:hypothetical protein